jgi:hypothetical protein
MDRGRNDNKREVCKVWTKCRMWPVHVNRHAFLGTIHELMVAGLDREARRSWQRCMLIALCSSCLMLHSAWATAC